MFNIAQKLNVFAAPLTGYKPSRYPALAGQWIILTPENKKDECQRNQLQKRWRYYAVLLASEL
jgi:hypothetical protein